MNETNELWECEECGARAINGKGDRWTAGDGVWLHDCARTKPGLLARAFRVDLGTVEQALVDLIRGMRRWGADTDGIHPDAWDAYVAAHKALGLPEPKESGE